jgi:hypothetical protein
MTLKQKSNLTLRNTAVTHRNTSIENRKSIETNRMKCPEPLFKNDSVYMNGFNKIVDTFQANIVEFNLQYLIDRIKKLEDVRNDQKNLKIKPTNLELKLKESLTNLLRTTTETTLHSSEIRQQIAREFISKLKGNIYLNESTLQIQSETKVFMSSNTSFAPSLSSSLMSSSYSNFQSLPLSLLMKTCLSSISSTTTSLRHSYNLRSNTGTTSKTKCSNQN